MKEVIAIDGPAGAGKSTVARLLAAELGFLYLDTGALYRALTWQAIRHGLDLADEAGLANLAGTTSLDIVPGPGGQQVFVDGEEATGAIREPGVTGQTFHLARSPGVRRALLPVQRDFARRHDLVADGRDTGTVVFPRARLKIYLDAPLEIRARRRRQDLDRAGTPRPLAEVRADLAARDRHDLTRAIAPLKQAPDAVYLDTGRLTAAAVVGRLAALYRARRQPEKSDRA